VGWFAYTVLWSMLQPVMLTVIRRGFEAVVFTGQMLFLLPNQQCQSTEVWPLLSLLTYRVNNIFACDTLGYID